MTDELGELRQALEAAQARLERHRAELEAIKEAHNDLARYVRGITGQG